MNAILKSTLVAVAVSSAITVFATTNPILTGNQLSTAIIIDNFNNTVNGAFCDLDGILDVAETAMLKLTITNTGAEPLQGIKAQISSDADITFANDGIIDFATISNSNDSTTGMIEATLNSAATYASISITVTFSSDDPTVALPQPLSLMAYVNYDLVQNRATEDFEHASTVWRDWRTSQENDNGGVDPEHFLGQWAVLDDEDFGNVAFGPNLSQNNDISLVSPTVTVNDSVPFRLNFDHYYDFQIGGELDPDDNTAWDGGVIEISIDDNPWTDVVAAGGTFLTGYNGTISNDNPALPQREGLTGVIDADDIASEGLTFADGLLNGRLVKFRFRIGSDGAIGAWGWNIDNVSFTNATTDTPFSSLVDDSGVCISRPPIVTTVTGPTSVIETDTVTLRATGFDRDNDVLSYSWSQITGTTNIDLSDTTGPTVTFNAPTVAADEGYTFTATAWDDTSLSVPLGVSVQVLANNAPSLSTERINTIIREGEMAVLNVSAIDAEGDDIQYSWTLDGATTVTTEPTFSYTGPSVSQDTTVTITVTASDHREVSEAVEMTVMVKNRDSGSGGFGLVGLLLVPLLFWRRVRNAPDR
ncbi:MAG: hypothetical protein ACI8WB_000826 [Phenylobacterium sp.]|jgi:hypothetical protein